MRIDGVTFESIGYVIVVFDYFYLLLLGVLCMLLICCCEKIVRTNTKYDFFPYFHRNNNNGMINLPLTLTTRVR